MQRDGERAEGESERERRTHTHTDTHATLLPSSQSFLSPDAAIGVNSTDAPSRLAHALRS